MRIAHIADAHLGYRAYNRVTSQGVNRREADVFKAFHAALQNVSEIQPDLVVVAGDLFHSVRPSNLSIHSAFRAFLALRKRTTAPVVIIGGNHDSPRSSDAGCILDLLDNIPDVYVAHSEYVQIKLPQLDASVFCLCHSALPQLSSTKIAPDTSSRYNILVAHVSFEDETKGYDQHRMGASESGRR